jgi:WS/DGAT/MGAT family acyltransferase
MMRNVGGQDLTPNADVGAAALTFMGGLDALFLYLESADTPMHVGSLHRFSLPAGFDGDVLDHFREQIRARMHLSEVLTRKLASMPLGIANPAWVDDDEVDLDYHVRRMRLPPPGSQAQLEDLAARLHSRLLDRTRPLWEMVVVEGLANGEIGFYAKVHHAGLDGQAGVALAQALYDLAPDAAGAASRGGAAEPGPAAVHHDAPGRARLLAGSLRNNASQLLALGRNLPGMVRSVVAAVAPSRAEDGSWKLPAFAGDSLLAPRTILNHTISGRRAFATASLPMAQARALAHRHGATLNDVVLAICGGALRDYLGSREALPDESLRAAVPVSVRHSGDLQSNTQAIMVRMTMASDVADPLERLRRVRDDSAATKAMLDDFKEVVPTDFPSVGVPWIAAALATLWGRGRLANAVPPLANLVVSNVPGPPVPLYMAGLRMMSYWPMSIPIHGMALNITVQSYAGSLDFGLIGCRRTVPDVARLAALLVSAFEELDRARAPAAVPRSRAGRKTAARRIRPAARAAGSR